ncbi:hypothetical protein [Pseudooceanicola nanhaiensis]|uniref:hypothetical protein n=1 Tax=Pseudooceanicola nanhaiensis TaxID=375761 RepID=UPI001CD3CD2D|nr:hypothetical protein [Pseudooceanicola nanhaiensis]MCA0919591.1 hypothetical protein [Pseudooceanicola nanhaiensis]
MRKALISLSFIAVAATASAAFAAYSVIDGSHNDLVSPSEFYDPSEPVLIEVSPEELGRCVMTIASVFQPPVDDSAPLQMSSDMPPAPPVRCVAK